MASLRNQIIFWDWKFQFFIFILFVYCFLGPHLQHMEVPRLGSALELLLPVYTTATGMQDPSCVCSLHHSSWQCQILNPLREAMDQICTLMAPSQIHFHCATKVTPKVHLLTVEERTHAIYLFSFFFRAKPMAYRSSQAKGQIGTAAAGLHHGHSNTSSKPHLPPTPQLLIHWATMSTPIWELLVNTFWIYRWINE